MVGEHTIRPRPQESDTPIQKIYDELELERLRQREIEDEDEMEQQTLGDSEEENGQRQRQKEIEDDDEIQRHIEQTFYFGWTGTEGESEDDGHNEEDEFLRGFLPEIEDEDEREEDNFLRGFLPEIEDEDEMERDIEESYQRYYQGLVDAYLESLESLQTDDPADKKRTTSRPNRKGKGDEDSESDFDSNLSEQADDEDPDLLTIGVETEKTWLTIEDMELARIDKLATYLRKDPLLPSPPANCESLLHCEGINFPLVHCAFENCEWVSDSRPCLRCAVDENTWDRHVAGGMWCALPGREHDRHGILGCCGQKTCLKQHIVDCHSDALLESCGEAELRQPFLERGKQMC